MAQDSKAAEFAKDYWTYLRGQGKAPEATLYGLDYEVAEAIQRGCHQCFEQETKNRLKDLEEARALLKARGQGDLPL